MVQDKRRQVRGGNELRVQKPVPPINPRRRIIPQAQLAIPKLKVKDEEAKPPTKKRLVVLDTNVLMHDPSSIFRFEEHDIYLPMIVIEELDNNKKGHEEKNRNAREASRIIDRITSGYGMNIKDGIPLAEFADNKTAIGRLFLQTEHVPVTKGVDKPDNQILAVVENLRSRKDITSDVVLISKDTNMRIKGRAAGMLAEDYHNDMVIEDTDLLYSGTVELKQDFWDDHSKDLESWQEEKHTFYKIHGPLVGTFTTNEFIHLVGENKLDAQVVDTHLKTVAVLRVVNDYTHKKNAVWGITARNREQNYALNLLLDPEIDFVSLLGVAGTGKTLLTLAAGLQQVLETKIYNEIIITRVTVPMGEDIGFLPGTEEEKMTPWMGALDDNLDVLSHNISTEKGDSESSSFKGDWGRSATIDLIRTRIKIKSLSFMRGRTFLHKFLIIDEAQNLTPKQVKALITRAGPGTKVVLLGNIAQIDTPYLTEGSSGLTYAVDRFKGWPHYGNITLVKGERSRLADHANKVL